MSTKEYYDLLADNYHFIYSNWGRDITRQAKALDRVIKENFGNSHRTLLDASCGIGTQSIGLAKLGYSVIGTDISANALERAQKEAITRGLSIGFQQADMRNLTDCFHVKFDLVIACDNSIPHLLTDWDIKLAFEQFYNVIRPGGGCIISVRDYSKINQKRNRIMPRTLHNVGKQKIIMYDVWEFQGNYYDMNTYVVKDDGEHLDIQVLRAQCYCVTIDKLEALMVAVGFKDVCTLWGRFFQPIIVGKKV